MKQLITLFLVFVSSFVQSNFEEGSKAVLDGNYEMAVHHLSKSLEEAETDAEKNKHYLMIAMANFLAPDHIDADYKNAFKYMKLASETGSTSIDHTFLGNFYQFGLGTEVDYKKAVEQYEMALKHSDFELALFHLGYMYRHGLGVEQDYLKAKELFEKAIALGDEESVVDLGLMYEFGIGIEKDIDKAVEYYQEALKKNSVIAGYRIDVINDQLPTDSLNRNYQEAIEHMSGINRPLDLKKAMELFEKGIERNHAESIFGYTNMLQVSSKTKRYSEIVELTEKAANLGLVKAQAELADIYNYGTGVTKDVKKSAFWQQKAADRGNVVSMQQLGDKYYFGRGVAKDFKQAINWYEKARALGDDESIQQLAEMYEAGEGVDEDINKAILLYEEAAALGNKDAYADLADIYMKGERGVDKDEVKSFKWAKEGADKGFPNSQNKLAIHYYRGIHVAVDMDEAFKWYQKAADQNFAKAYYNLGNFYESGKAVKKDRKEAFKWFLKSAEEDLNPEAQHKVGTYYDFGYYVQEDNDKAVEWYEKAANQELKKAQIALGSFYYFGDDDYDKNYKKSADWYSKAALNDEDDKVKKTYKFKPTSYGSGFFVTRNHIITNNHVTDDCDEIEVKNKNYKSVVELVDSDKNTDLSLLITGNPQDNFLSLRNGKAVRTGEQAIALGYPLASSLGSDLKVTIGNVAALTGYENNIAELQLTAPVQPGNSGGPLIDENGNVIGVIVSRLENVGGLKKGRIAQNVNFAIKSNMAKIFMDLNMIDYQVRKPGNKVAIEKLVEDAKSSVVQIICKKE